MSRGFNTGRVLPAILAMALSVVSAAQACDSCGCSVVPLNEKTTDVGWQFAMGEQYTDFDRLQQDGQQVQNTNNQFIHSSITELQVGYNFDPKVGVTLTIPYVSRTFHRILGGTQSQTGTLSGLGDMILMGRYVVARHQGHDYSSVVTFNVGLKLPTGSPDELQEQVAALLGGPDSVVGGHDLALGSGSLDGLVGASASYHHFAWIADAVVQYAARNPGAFGYRYGNELQWDVSVGRYLHSSAATGQFTALSVVLNGETKNEDVFAGNSQVIDTGVNEVYLGPRLTTTLGHNQFGSLEVDIPIHEANSDLQLVPSSRIKGSYTLRF